LTCDFHAIAFGSAKRYRHRPYWAGDQGVDTGFKMLVGAACVAVIGAVGYFFWSEYEKAAQAEKAREIAVERAAVEHSAAKQAANDALIAECNRRVPSQSTENLKALYKQCLDDNRMFFSAY
jgi:hypothetical protein